MAALTGPWADPVEDSLGPRPGAGLLSSGVLHRGVSLISGFLEPKATQPPLLSPFVAVSCIRNLELSGVFSHLSYGS